MKHRTGFLFGAQYYRAPTPATDCWVGDLRRMAELGCNAVKFWVQWRWSHRAADRFIFDDLDRLLDMAGANKLAVTLNTILDVSPVWLFARFPDARQVTAAGRAIESQASGCRQIGGLPGPCYNHPGARDARQAFMTRVVEHFRGHAALSMWDVWNEPELCLPSRAPDPETAVCYCDHCRAGFLDWLRGKYANLAGLNDVWGRCYEDWSEVELPRVGQTIGDYLDWREFHIDTMTAEARWRLELVARLDPTHACYLHVVPNTMAPFNAVTTAADDFALAEHCEVFAATMNGGPVFPAQVLSAARGKLVYNVESHVNHGCTSMHQRMLGPAELADDLVPQIGLGVRGFLFWQFRPELLGFESPAWGLVAPDGSDRPVTRAAAEWWRRIRSHADALLACPPAPAAVGIWKSRRNEIFHYALHGSFKSLIETTEAYLHALYWQSVPYRIVSGQMLADGQLDGVRLLIMPSPYLLDQPEADALARWVEAGGVLLAEAHLGGYNGTTGRHSRVTPGCGLAERWGIRESDSTSSYHLRLIDRQAFAGQVTADVGKALADGTSGGEVFPIALCDGGNLRGALRYAEFAGADMRAEGSFAGRPPCVVSRPVGRGGVVLAGTNLGQGAKADGAAFARFVGRWAARASAGPALGAAGGDGQIHVDVLHDGQRVRFLVLRNRSVQPQSLTLDFRGSARGILSERTFHFAPGTPVELPASFVDLVEVMPGR